MSSISQPMQQNTSLIFRALRMFSTLIGNMTKVNPLEIHIGSIWFDYFVVETQPSKQPSKSTTEIVVTSVLVSIGIFLLVAASVIWHRRRRRKRKQATEKPLPPRTSDDSEKGLSTQGEAPPVSPSAAHGQFAYARDLQIHDSQFVNVEGNQNLYHVQGDLIQVLTPP